MEKSTGTLGQFNSFGKNLEVAHNYFKNNLSETKKEIGEGLGQFKDGMTCNLNRAGTYIKNDLVLPVNNFIKDLSQIENEFEAERRNSAEYCMCIQGIMVSAEEVLKMSMEENY